MNIERIKGIIKGIIKTPKGKLIAIGSTAGVVTVAATVTACVIIASKPHAAPLVGLTPTSSVDMSAYKIRISSTPSTASSASSFSTNDSNTSSRSISSDKAISPTITENPQPPVAVQSVDIIKRSVTIKVGKSAKLNATVTPSNAANKTLTWSSSNTNVATVSSNGTVTAKKAGKATIRATSVNGKEDTCTVKVESKSTSSKPSSTGKSSGSTSSSKSSSPSKSTSKPKMPENKKISCTVAGQSATINPAGHYISFLIDVSSLGRDSVSFMNQELVR